MTVCGETKTGDCFPDINEAGGSLIRITFTSGFCCQHCGYRLWVRCVPGGQEKGKREIEEQVVQAITTYTISFTALTYSD